VVQYDPKITDYRIRKSNGSKRNALTDIISEMGLMGKMSYEKFIPKEYLFGSRKTRESLLHGLMDTDGYADDHVAEYSTSSKQLALDFQFIVESLGGTTRPVIKNPVYTYNGEKRKGKVSYRFQICMPREISPFRCEIKKSKYIPRSKYQPRRIIRTIEYVGRKDAVCIRIDSQDSLYVTNHCILTHNTYSIKKIIDSFPSAHIALAAPTGKAAKRMSEQCNREATTIHRLLGARPNDEDGEFEFEYGSNNPIPADLIVLDECSMLDTKLVASFLRAVAPSTRLILVGDFNQLPSVGAGNVLRNLIDSGTIPMVELTIIKRQDPGLIILNCHAIRNGKDITVDNESKDFFFLEREEAESVQNTIIDLVVNRLPKAYGVHPYRDIQVITALREKTILSCKVINEILQEKLNKNPILSFTKFRLDDKVIQLRNTVAYDIKNHVPTTLANGDIGYVKEIQYDVKKLVVEFEFPVRLVEISAKDNELDLAYALTVHKYQGSEAPIIVSPIHRSSGPLILQRNWLYTCISRAKSRCVLVGQRSEIPQIISRKNQQVRYSRLSEFLKG
jgi:hypothetical protein